MNTRISTRFYRLLSLACLAALLLMPVGGAALAGPTVSAPGDQAQPQTLPDGSIVGVPWTGEKGITETVAQIMERQRVADAAAAANPGKSEPKLTKPWLDYSTVPLKRENPDAPAVSQWPPAPAGAAAIEPLSPQTVGTNFKGVDLTESGYIPPDSMGDVGPTQILMHENGRIKLFDKAGNANAGLNATDAVFWASVAAGISDPEVRYDRLSGRWFVLAISIAETVNNEIVLAVSSGPTITSQSSFTFYQFNVGTVATGDAASFCDYPSLGVDNLALYSGCNMFNSAGSFRWTSAFVIRKSSVLSGGPIVATGFTNLTGGTTAGPYAPRGVDNDDPCATEGYFIGTDVATYGTLYMRRVSTPSGTPTLSGNLSLTVATTTAVLTQPARGSTTNLDTVDDRLFMTSIHKNKITGVSSLWTAHQVEVNASCVGTTTGTSRRIGARWYEIGSLTGTPSVTQYGTLCTTSGTTTGANSLRGYIFPTVVETGQGHMALGSSYASTAPSPGEYAGVAVAGRLRTDAAGATQAATVAQVGLNSYTVTGSGTRNRWGDYSFTDVDPNDDMTVWTFQEYADSTANIWAVRAIQLKAPAPPPSTPSNVVEQNRAHVTVTCTRSSGTLEFFDPGPDTCTSPTPNGPGYANHLTATATNGVTVNSISFTSVSQVLLNLNTVNAPANSSTIVTIANPDGQTATCTVSIGNPTGITLASMTAAVQANAIEITWDTVSEVGNAGFNLYRDSSPDGPGTKLNASLIPSQGSGSPEGYHYSYLDSANLVPNTTYYYWLEDVSETGVATRHEPVSVPYTGSPTAVGLAGFSAATSSALPAALPFAAAGLALVALAGLGLKRRR